MKLITTIYKKKTYITKMYYTKGTILKEPPGISKRLNPGALSSWYQIINCARTC
jgi:hypothetical protein